MPLEAPIQKPPCFGENKKRLFVFGCSYTRYMTATWADFLGVNFDEYYNYAAGGSSNTHICDRFFEASSKHTFDPNTDCIAIMTTGISRFSYYRNRRWELTGEIYNSKAEQLIQFRDNIWSDDYGVYKSWSGLNAMCQFLKSSKIEHVILTGVDNKVYTTGTFDLSNKSQELLSDLFSMPSTTISLEDWRDTYYTKDQLLHWGADRFADTHPTQRMHYEYMTHIFPEYDNQKTRAFYRECEQRLFIGSKNIQSTNFNTFMTPIRKTDSELYG